MVCGERMVCVCVFEPVLGRSRALSFGMVGVHLVKRGTDFKWEELWKRSLRASVIWQKTEQEVKRLRNQILVSILVRILDTEEACWVLVLEGLLVVNMEFKQK